MRYFSHEKYKFNLENVAIFQGEHFLNAVWCIYGCGDVREPIFTLVQSTLSLFASFSSAADNFNPCFFILSSFLLFSSFFALAVFTSLILSSILVLLLVLFSLTESDTILFGPLVTFVVVAHHGREANFQQKKLHLEHVVSVLYQCYTNVIYVIPHVIFCSTTA